MFPSGVHVRVFQSKLAHRHAENIFDYSVSLDSARRDETH